jgi:hypothetical protein
MNVLRQEQMFGLTEQRSNFRVGRLVKSSHQTDGDERLRRS